MAARSAKARPTPSRNYLEQNGTAMPPEVRAAVERIARSGGTPLVVAENRRAMGVIHLKDIVKGGMRDRFAQLRAMGIRTVMITGDNPLTAAAIAREAGVDDFLAQATPEDKLKLIRSEQAGGKLVAMTGDGTNDAPALAQADVGVAMNTGTQAAKEAGNMVDLDSNPTKLIEVVEIGKQLLMTRGALTTFSIANDVAKYFAIIPAMFAATFPVLNALNIMRLKTPQSAILSAVIFNALIIIALIPLALRGVKYRAMNAEALLRRNLLIYGVGGLIAPFVGIKIIDVLITARGLGLEDYMKKNLITAFLMTVVMTRSARPHLSPGRHRHGAASFQRQGERPDHSSQRHSHRIAHHRLSPSPSREIFSSSSISGRQRLRRGQLRRYQPRPHEPEAHRPRPRRRRNASSGESSQPVPVDLITTSASGLDPDISPAAADFQAPRVARERGISESRSARFHSAAHASTRSWPARGATGECPGTQPRARRSPLQSLAPTRRIAPKSS